MDAALRDMSSRDFFGAVMWYIYVWARLDKLQNIRTVVLIHHALWEATSLFWEIGFAPVDHCGNSYVMLIHIISWSDFTICSSHSDKTSEHLISPVDHLLTNFDTANETKVIRCALPGPDRLHMGQHTYIFTKQTTFTIMLKTLQQNSAPD